MRLQHPEEKWIVEVSENTVQLCPLLKELGEYEEDTSEPIQIMVKCTESEMRLVLRFIDAAPRFMEETRKFYKNESANNVNQAFENAIALNNLHTKIGATLNEELIDWFSVNRAYLKEWYKYNELANTHPLKAIVDLKVPPKEFYKNQRYVFHLLRENRYDALLWLVNLKDYPVVFLRKNVSELFKTSLEHRYHFEFTRRLFETRENMITKSAYFVGFRRAFERRNTRGVKYLYSTIKKVSERVLSNEFCRFCKENSDISHTRWFLNLDIKFKQETLHKGIINVITKPRANLEQIEMFCDHYSGEYNVHYILGYVFWISVEDWHLCKMDVEILRWLAHKWPVELVFIMNYRKKHIPSIVTLLLECNRPDIVEFFYEIADVE